VRDPQCGTGCMSQVSMGTDISSCVPSLGMSHQHRGRSMNLYHHKIPSMCISPSSMAADEQEQEQPTLQPKTSVHSCYSMDMFDMPMYRGLLQLDKLSPGMGETTESNLTPQSRSQFMPCAITTVADSNKDTNQSRVKLR
jgi:hypothetical protein